MRVHVCGWRGLNGFFGLFTNVLLNVIVLTGLCLGVVQLPADTVFGRILPALGIALPLGNLFYAYLAWQLGKKEGRSDVTAMPYGPSVPHMFIVVFLIMLPVYLETKDPMLAWHAGLAWCFIIGVIVLLGAFVGPQIRAMTPRAAMLGTLAGISVAFISMRPAFQMWEMPWIGLVCFAIVLIAWTANVRLPGGLPGGLVAVIVGSVIGWVVSLARLERLHAAGRGRQVARAVRAAPADLLGRRLDGPGEGRAAARHRDSARHLQLHRGDEQRRERLGGRRQLQPAQDPARRRPRRDRRLDARQPVPARGLHRPSGLEGGRRPHRLFARHRRRDRARLLPRPHRAAARA